ncbi:hypothetical protein QFZ75_005909 [Streptomyces sp. V3I8]|uniref:hypothetical protein n=1 Tax=Streptomyces sp. V3I8 TaxID=3042279 RepID=UPI00277D821A|nr:hypothetical protein [Streptomyces sp. V3I8]MDQ1039493.1 hypothetical protein [Streptomyces sp. V3I8]
MRDVRDDELRAGLRDSAEAYEPDRARILARVERGMAGGESAPRSTTRPSAPGWLRVAGATAAVAGVLAVGAYTVASAVRDGTDEQTVAVTPGPDRTPRTPAPGKAPLPPNRTSPSASASAPSAGTEDGPLWSDGSVDPHSNDFWAQSDVTVKTGRRLTALEVVLKVRQTGGVTSSGAWRSAPEEDFTATVAERDGFLVYTWVLKPGRTVWPGEWVFAGQYDHDRGGRDAGDDRYTVAARADGEQRSVAGGFARTGSADGRS